MSKKAPMTQARCALCGAKDVSEPRGDERYCRDCWDKKIAVEEIVAREFALKRYIRAHSAEKYLIYHSTLKRPCGQLIVVDDGYDLFLTMVLYPSFAWDEEAYHLDGDPEGRTFAEILVDVALVEVIEPWGGGKWHLEIIRATQAAQSTTLVTAPRLTLFNGQRAYVLVSRQTAYVSDLEPIVAQQAVAFNPTIGLVQSGVLLDVQATVSSDRKYVTLTLRPQLATLIDLLPFTFQSTEGTAGTTQPIPDGNGGFVGTNPATGTIQQPILQITEVRTTVSVPDGGTLLLGGQTIAGEIEREAGIPVLSKIPFLKRLFTNRSMAKDEQILLILVKPTIVIQREQEQRQFPLLSSRIAQ